jgi:hypothetical protein
MIIRFKQITDEEYEKIKKELTSRFKFARVKRNTQQYALGGFNVNPKDYENGFTPKQIDALSIFLTSLDLDDSSLGLESQEVYTKENTIVCPEELLGTKNRYVSYGECSYGCECSKCGDLLDED